MKQFSFLLRFLILFFILFPFQVHAYSGERVVTILEDEGPELYGSLRRILDASCNEDGDDVILFDHTTLPELRIHLRTPLVIPANCRGRVTLRGSSEVETILDGSNIENGQASLIIKSWGNTIEGMTFLGFQTGAGISVENNDNIIRNNFMGVQRRNETSLANQVGMRVSGDWNLIEQNTISANHEEGVLLEGSANTLYGNSIGNRETYCEHPPSNKNQNDWPTSIHEILNEMISTPSGPVFPVTPPNCGNGGAGIRIRGSRNLIGNFVSPNFTFDPTNKIYFNHGRGIVVEVEAQRNAFIHNSIAYNVGLGIALEGAANSNILAPQNLQLFPSDAGDSSTASIHYNLTGTAIPGNTLDLYLVAPDDPDDSSGKGEGIRYLNSFNIVDENFSFDFESLALGPTSILSAISCDRSVNCSEFSERIVMSLDSDQDSIPDAIEDPNGNRQVDMGETDPYLIDSDGDGLPDSVEDRNGNGIVDPGETDPRKADTDNDGISDFIETGGDGRYDPSEGDTDPLNPDTDGDGISDGMEDLNHNGIIEINERDPRDPHA